MENFIQSGNLALKSGNKELARSYFRQAIHQDRNNVQAWLGLAASVESDFERVHCLQTIINIDPGNKSARDALDRLVNGLADGKADAESLDNSFDQIRSIYATSNVSETGEQFPDTINGVPVKKEPLPESGAFIEKSEIVWDDDDEEELTVEKNHETPKKVKSSTTISRKIFIWGGAALMLVCILAAALSGVAMQILQMGKTPTPVFMSVAKPVLAEELTLTALAVTPTISSPTPLPSPTLRPTETSIPTATLQAANPTVEARFEEIRQEVSDLRGLAILNTKIPAYAVNKQEAENYFYEYVHSDDFALSLENRKQALVLLVLLNRLSTCSLKF